MGDEMKKQFIIINGTMASGKTTISRLLNKRLENSVWLDGDWCWSINPFVVNEENKAMVEDNIKHLLGNFMRNNSIKYVIFSWVLHTDALMDKVRDWVKDFEFDEYRITLTCSEDVLRERILSRSSKDEKSLQEKDEQAAASIKKQSLYSMMSTTKLDNSQSTEEEILDKILNIIK